VALRRARGGTLSQSSGRWKARDRPTDRPRPTVTSGLQRPQIRGATHQLQRLPNEAGRGPQAELPSATPARSRDILRAVALSGNAHALLELLPTNGRAANLANLKAKLGLSEYQFDNAQGELTCSGLAVLAGKGGPIARVSVGPSDLSIEAAMLLAALPPDVSTVGNYSVRSQLALDDDTYAEAKRELREKGLIKVGPGYGGTVARVSPVPGTRAVDELPVAGLVRKEQELYEPFADWLRSSLADQDIAFAEARITAQPAGYQRSSERWSRPDVTAVQVFRYEWLPDISVEVSTYEIKQAADAKKLESVYEAAAHGRWAHRASLVVEQAEGVDPVPGLILDEVRRFRLGLYAMRRRLEGGFDVREIMKPPLTQESQPEDLNDLLGYFLGENRVLRQSYLRAIGQ